MTSCDRTDRLRSEGTYQIEDRTMGLAPDEAICPGCNLAFFVGERAFSWGVCPSCIGVALVPVPVDSLDPPGFTPPLF